MQFPICAPAGPRAQVLSAIAHGRTVQVSQARDATRAFTDLALTRVSWLADRITALGPEADEIAKFGCIYRQYWVRAALARMWSEDETTERVDDRWRAESEARTKLLDQVKLLADLPHPPRASLYQRWLHRMRSSARRRGGRRSRPRRSDERPQGKVETA
jgi:hypothetical protein